MPFQQTYGGVIGAALYAIWSKLCLIFDGDPNHQAMHASYLFGFLPSLFAVSVYVLARQYSGLLASLAVGLIAAVNFNFFLIEIPNQFHFFATLIGFCFLALKARHENPMRSLSPLQLLGVGIFSGFALYTSRETSIAIGVFFIPWAWLLRKAQQLKPKTLSDKVVFGAAIVLFTTFVYLRIYGDDLGTFFGRRVKVHSQPQLTLAAAFALMFAIKQNFAAILKVISNRAIQLKILHLAIGCLIGFLPEIIFIARTEIEFSKTFHDPYSYEQIFLNIAQIPHALAAFFKSGNGISQNVPTLIFLASIFFCIKQARRHSQVTPILVWMLFAATAFVTAKTYASAPPIRYLMPAVPALFAGLAVFFGYIFQQPNRTKFIAMAAVLLSLFAQYDGQKAAISDMGCSKLNSEAQLIIKAFKDTKTKVVLSDDYWNTSQLTFAADSEIYFVSDDRIWSPFEGRKLAKNEMNVGVLLSSRASSEQFKSMNRTWALTPLIKIGSSHWLYIGRALP